MSEDATEDPMVAALLRERAGYVQHGKTDRVAQVDEQLKLRGHDPDSSGEARTSSPRSQPPKARRQPRKDTT
jgi:hypothetical protein